MISPCLDVYEEDIKGTDGPNLLSSGMSILSVPVLNHV